MSNAHNLAATAGVVARTLLATLNAERRGESAAAHPDADKIASIDTEIADLFAGLARLPTETPDEIEAFADRQAARLRQLQAQRRRAAA